MDYKAVEDHLNRKIYIPFPPRKIVSLCPSITETLFELNISNEMVGRTRYCKHPSDQVKEVTIVGGTKEVKFSVIENLKPDLIIAEKEENPKEIVEKLSRKFPVYVTNVESYDDAIKMIKDLGSITDREKQAQQMIEAIYHEFLNLDKLNQANKIKAAYVIWQKPYMVAGNHTFIHSMLEQCGLYNVFRDYPVRYPEVSLEDFKKLSPDLIFLSSEPYPFKESHKASLEKIFPDTKVFLVDGEIFSWYGARMIKAPKYLNQLLEEITI
ncbi:helical backbone metal receptor [Microaerobacter geothermalis]|uniref:ABC transporter substrate-binding protein n=1 Tax=Microaerobacter geothermalis TaxID=674972 RepID=UPI001F2AFC49|nr:helical backbone metal receptor [Microaerobacter geothermalis]MCF6093109.1 helical backbone metal receptor [Microaerobacter geothermalis]